MSDHLKWKLLTNVYDTNMANIIESILDQAEILVLKKQKGSGAYMEIVAGISNTGIDLYVPEVHWTEAQEIINSSPDMDTDQDINNFIDCPSDTETDDELFFTAQRRRNFKILLTLIFIVPSILGLLYFIFDLLKSVVNTIIY